MESDALHRKVRHNEDARDGWNPIGHLLRHRAALQGGGHVARPGSFSMKMEFDYKA